MIKLVGLCLMLWAISPQVLAEEKFTVKLLSDRPSPDRILVRAALIFTLPLSQSFRLNEYQFRCQHGKLKLYREKRLLLSSSRVKLHSANFQLHTNQRKYAGDFELSCDQTDKLGLRLQIPKNQYLEIVVGSETEPDTPLEALKAQAILSRTWLQRHKKRPYLLDTTQDQAFRGEEYRRARVRLAVHDTEDQLLLYAGQPVEVYYHADCGGRTSDLRAFNPLAKSPPYLQSLRCPASDHQSKKTRLKTAQWRKLFPTQPIPKLLLQDRSGRPLLWQLDHTHQMSGYSLWLKIGQSFGWHLLPGSNYRLVKEEEEVILLSKGLGHGVGLCQRGATELARQGKNYREILNFYLPGTMLSS